MRTGHVQCMHIADNTRLPAGNNPMSLMCIAFSCTAFYGGFRRTVETKKPSLSKPVLRCAHFVVCLFVCLCFVFVFLLTPIPEEEKNEERVI